MVFEDLLKLTRKQIRKEYECIGKGSSREVYELANEVVLKVAKDDRGIAQILTEVTLHDEMKSSINPLPIFCPILFSSNNLLVMPKAIPLNQYKLIPEEKKLEVRRFKFAIKKVCNIIKSEMNNQANYLPEEEVIRIKESELFETIYRLYREYQLLPGDMSRPSSWGLYDGRIVLIDYGLTKNIWNKFYRIAPRKQNFYSPWRKYA